MDDNKTMNRRDFLKGVATGACAGLFASMGAYSYTKWAYSRLPAVERKQMDFGVCRSVKVTNISETSWFSNADLMKKASLTPKNRKIQLLRKSHWKSHQPSLP